MSWPNVVLTGGSLILVWAMLPALSGAIRAPLRTSLPLTIVLAAFAVTYALIGYVVAALTVALQAALWAVVGWRSLKTRTTNQDGISSGNDEAGIGQSGGPT